MKDYYFLTFDRLQNVAYHQTSEEMRNKTIMTLAGKIAKLNKYSESGLNLRNWRSLNLRVANSAVGMYGEHAGLYEVRKKSGAVERRVLIANWSGLNIVKGTGHPIPDGYKLFVDLAKQICGEPSTVMFKHYERIE